MLKVELEIYNHTAHSCSPIQFLQKYIFKEASEFIAVSKGGRVANYWTPYAKIKAKKLKQI